MSSSVSSSCDDDALLLGWDGGSETGCGDADSEAEMHVVLISSSTLAGGEFCIESSRVTVSVLVLPCESCDTY